MLNPNAPAFVPRAAPSAGPSPSAAASWAPYSYGQEVYGQEWTEGPLSESELEELEACDEWVRTMALLEEAECEHLIATALTEAPERAAAIEAAMMAGLTQPRSHPIHEGRAKGRKSGKPSALVDAGNRGRA